MASTCHSAIWEVIDVGRKIVGHFNRSVKWNKLHKGQQAYTRLHTHRHTQFRMVPPGCT